MRSPPRRPVDCACTLDASIWRGWRGWSEAAVEAYAARQHELLDAADDLLPPGGRLLYVTCTFAPGRPDAVGADDVLPTGACGRLWPHRTSGDGHVLALLRRRPDAPVPAPADAATLAA